MKRWICGTWTAALLLVAASVAAQEASLTPAVPPLQAVPALDLPRYLGRWYEVAKFPNRFQRQCVADTQADYSWQADGSLQVRNRCRDAAGVMQEAVGQARPLPGGLTSQLQVRFAPAWLSWLPWVWGDYWVIDLDADYQWVAISEPSREYLWVLSRSPQLAAPVYAALLQRLRRQGLAVERLEPTVQRP